jgi:hypothetical protein
MSVGFPVPDTVRVSEVRVTVLLLGFANTTCCTGTLVAPESWFELPGGLDPCEADTVTSVGVPVGVIVVVQVEVLVKVSVGVEEGVEVGVKVFWGVALGVKVAVKVAVCVGLLVGVLDGVGVNV